MENNQSQAIPPNNMFYDKIIKYILILEYLCNNEYNKGIKYQGEIVCEEKTSYSLLTENGIFEKEAITTKEIMAKEEVIIALLLKELS